MSNRFLKKRSIQVNKPFGLDPTCHSTSSARLWMWGVEGFTSIDLWPAIESLVETVVQIHAQNSCTLSVSWPLLKLHCPLVVCLYIKRSLQQLATRLPHFRRHVLLLSVNVDSMQLPLMFVWNKCALFLRWKWLAYVKSNTYFVLQMNCLVELLWRAKQFKSIQIFKKNRNWRVTAVKIFQHNMRATGCPVQSVPHVSHVSFKNIQEKN